ncbi:MAG: tetratricopeptide repeat protein, partial [Acidobacteria bacterium]|nr:tetratricopeptide repeat protein [Acidobacteriota bacterium]
MPSCRSMRSGPARHRRACCSPTRLFPQLQSGRCGRFWRHPWAGSTGEWRKTRGWSMAWRNSGPFLRALVVGVWLLVALGLILWRDPDFWRSPDDLYQKSATLEKQGSLQQASAVLDQLLQRTPRDPGLWVRKGYLELQASRLENAHRSFGTALSLSSGNIEASLGLAETASRLKDPSSAWKALNSLDPWSLEPGQLRRRAQLLAGMGRFSEALQDQRRLISLMPEDPQVLLEGARLAAAARDWEQAAALAARARDLSGDRALRQAAGELMAQSLHAMGRLEEAASAYDRIAGPENLDVRAQLAMQSKRFSVAAGLYGELAASRPDDRGVLGELARALQLSGNLTASASAYRNLLRAGDPDGRVRIRYAWVL